jgi:hypothetical protein
VKRHVRSMLRIGTWGSFCLEAMTHLVNYAQRYSGSSQGILNFAKSIARIFAKSTSPEFSLSSN